MATLVRPQSAMHAGDQVSARVARRLEDPLILASVVAGLLVIISRLALEFGQGQIAVLPLLLTIPILARLSPPVTGLFILYSGVLFSEMDASHPSLGFHIPVLSVMTVWGLGWLVAARWREGSFRALLSPFVIRGVAFLVAFFALGILVSWVSGSLANPLIASYDSSNVRAWVAVFVLGVLCVRRFDDVWIILLGLPFAALIYPLALPLQAWHNLASYGLTASAVENVGLGTGVAGLNQDILGQTAAAAATAAAAIILTSRRSLAPWLLGPIAVSVIVVVLSGARQGILGLLIGLVLAAALSRPRLAVLSSLVTVVGAYVLFQAIVATLPAGSGFQTRYLELTQSPTTWQTGSFEARQGDIQAAWNTFWQSPIIGVGFGGQNAATLPYIPDVSAVSALEAQDAEFAVRGTHNLPVGILAQTGIVGAALLILCFGGALRRFLPLTRELRPHSRAVWVALLSTLGVMILTQNISGGLGLGSAPIVFLFGVMLGAGTTEQTEDEAPESSLAPARSRGRPGSSLALPRL